MPDMPICWRDYATNRETSPGDWMWMVASGKGPRQEAEQARLRATHRQAAFLVGVSRAGAMWSTTRTMIPPTQRSATANGSSATRATELAGRRVSWWVVYDDAPESARAAIDSSVPVAPRRRRGFFDRNARRRAF